MQINTTAAGRERQQLPWHVIGELGALGDHAEQSGQADAHAVTEQADDACLEQDHCDDPAIGRSHRLERPELLEVLDREVVESLARDGGSRPGTPGRW